MNMESGDTFQPNQPEKIPPALTEEDLEKLFEADEEAMRNSDTDTVKKHTEQVKHFLEQHGWVDTRGMGDKAEHGFWLMVLHSDHDADFQKEALGELQKAVESERAPKWQLAYLVDRVRRNASQPQLFGIWPFRQESDGTITYVPIEDEEHIEERWREYGLYEYMNVSSFDEYRQQELERYKKWIESQE